MAKKKSETKAEKAPKQYTPSKEIISHLEKELGIVRPGDDSELLFYYHSKRGALPITYIGLCKMLSTWSK